MTTHLTAHFDGHVLIPDKPVKLPTNQTLQVSVVSISEKPDNEDDVGEGAWMRAASKAAGSDFLAEEPDLYSSKDGLPFHDKG